MQPPDDHEPFVVYLIRHAQTAWNAEGRFQGQVDTTLSPTGRRQALALGTRLAKLGLPAIYSSDLARARETAELAASVGQLRVEVDPAFREVDVGEWQGLTFDQVREIMPSSFEEWQLGRPGFHFPKGESYEEAAARAMRRIEEVCRGPSGRRLAVVSHGGVLRALVYLVLGLDHGRRGRVSLSNAGISAIGGEPGRWRLILLNDTCHLEALPPAAQEGDQSPQAKGVGPLLGTKEKRADDSPGRVWTGKERDGRRRTWPG